MRLWADDARLDHRIIILKNRLDRQGRGPRIKDRSVPSRRLPRHPFTRRPVIRGACYPCGADSASRYLRFTPHHRPTLIRPSFFATDSFCQSVSAVCPQTCVAYTSTSSRVYCRDFDASYHCWRPIVPSLCRRRSHVKSNFRTHPTALSAAVPAAA